MSRDQKPRKLDSYDDEVEKTYDDDEVEKLYDDDDDYYEVESHMMTKNWKNIWWCWWWWWLWSGKTDDDYYDYDDNAEVEKSYDDEVEKHMMIIMIMMI